MFYRHFWLTTNTVLGLSGFPREIHMRKETQKRVFVPRELLFVTSQMSSCFLIEKYVIGLLEKIGHVLQLSLYN